MTANRKRQPTDVPANEQGRTDDRGVAEAEDTQASSDENQGEGNREAAREYNADQQEFVKSGKVKSAARAAAPRSKREADDMLEAERKGKMKARK